MRTTFNSLWRKYCEQDKSGIIHCRVSSHICVQHSIKLSIEMTNIRIKSSSWSSNEMAVPFRLYFLCWTKQICLVPSVWNTNTVLSHFVLVWVISSPWLNARLSISIANTTVFVQSHLSVLCEFICIIFSYHPRLLHWFGAKGMPVEYLSTVNWSVKTDRKNNKVTSSVLCPIQLYLLPLLQKERTLNYPNHHWNPVTVLSLQYQIPW